MNSVVSSVEEKMEAGVAAHTFTLSIWEAEADLCVFIASLVCIATSRLARATKWEIVLPTHTFFFDIKKKRSGGESQCNGSMLPNLMTWVLCPGDLHGRKWKLKPTGCSQTCEFGEWVFTKSKFKVSEQEHLLTRGQDLNLRHPSKRAEHGCEYLEL